eukprot:scaffold705_cov402-Prasinococcus_capsulatus_cf.AAC.30
MHTDSLHAILPAPRGCRAGLLTWTLSCARSSVVAYAGAGALQPLGSRSHRLSQASQTGTRRSKQERVGDKACADPQGSGPEPGARRSGATETWQETGPGLAGRFWLTLRASSRPRAEWSLAHAAGDAQQLPLQPVVCCCRCGQLRDGRVVQEHKSAAMQPVGSTGVSADAEDGDKEGHDQMLSLYLTRLALLVLPVWLGHYFLTTSRKTAVYASSGRKIQRVMQAVDSRMYKYRPPLLFYTSLGQLIADVLLDKLYIGSQRKRYPLRRETIKLHDGGRVALEWVSESEESSPAPNSDAVSLDPTPVLLVFHTITYRSGWIAITDL